MLDGSALVFFMFLGLVMCAAVGSGVGAYKLTERLLTRGGTRE